MRSMPVTRVRVRISASIGAGVAALVWMISSARSRADFCEACEVLAGARDSITLAKPRGLRLITVPGTYW